MHCTTDDDDCIVHILLGRKFLEGRFFRDWWQDDPISSLKELPKAHRGPPWPVPRSRLLVFQSPKPFIPSISQIKYWVLMPYIVMHCSTKQRWDPFLRLWEKNENPQRLSLHFFSFWTIPTLQIWIQIHMNTQIHRYVHKYRFTNTKPKYKFAVARATFLESRGA